jgi:glycosyltransferase involved in cell wall biosynthesis
MKHFWGIPLRFLKKLEHFNDCFMSLRILSLSLDQNILKTDSDVFKRQFLLSSVVDEYIIVIPSISFQEKNVASNITIYSSGGGNKLIQFFHMCRLVKKILKKNQINILTVQDLGYVGFVAARLAKIYRLPFEVQIHGLLEKNNFIRNFLLHYVISRATVIRVVSKRLKNILHEKFKVSNEIIHVLPILSDHVEYMRNYSQVNKDFMFLTVGRLVPIKNMLLQIRAMAEVVKKHSDIRLVILGDGPERIKLEHIISEYNLKNYIKFEGWVNKNNIIEYYKKADCFLLTSNAEGWGMVVVEALQYGLPVIMTDVGCAGEIIIDDISGKVIPVGGLKDLIRSMEDMIQNQSLREKLGKAGRQIVKRLPTFEDALLKYKEIWMQAIKLKNL